MIRLMVVQVAVLYGCRNLGFASGLQNIKNNALVLISVKTLYVYNLHFVA